MLIQVLPDHIANQIAAGEVVERPASVVRELVDNAVDAGASRISIFLRTGGKTSIRVVDDGGGMSRDDARLAFKRHATSKLTSIADLETIRTLGFRGEALPSIASISKIRITTRDAKAEVATEVCLTAGGSEEVRAVPGPVGTDIEVSSLFFNTPARQKFLKSQRSEEMKIKQWILQYCLAHPQITFALEFDEREVFRENARASLEERARILVGGSVVAVQLQVNGISVSGVLAHPGNAQGEAKGLTLLVNGRLVSDRMLLRAAKDGFGATLKDREFPVGVLSLVIPGSEVDVNVHPQKSEIRFRNSSSVYVAVLRAVQSAISEFRGPFGQAMAASGAMPAVVEFRGAANSSSYYGSGSSGGTGSLPFGSVVPHVGHEVFTSSAPLGADNTERPGFVRESASAQDRHHHGLEFRFSDLVFRAQLFECYLLCEHAEQFFIVDMHAAHERYQYNQVRQALRERRRVSQKLLLPLAVPLGEFGLSNLKEHEPMLEDLGFVFAWQADEQVQVTEVPTTLSGKDVASMLRDIATLNPEDGGGVAPVDYILDQIAARIACHSSIRSGKKMAREEVEALFALLDSTECSAACPHGRPVIVSFSLREVEAWFGRDK